MNVTFVQSDEEVVAVNRIIRRHGRKYERKPCYVVVQSYDLGNLNEPLVNAVPYSRAGRHGAVRYVRDQEASYRDYHAGRRMRSFGSAETGRQLQIEYAEGRLLRIKWKIVKM